MTEHTYRFGATPDDRCPLCQSRDCDHRGYSRRYIRFVKAHKEAFEAAYLDGNAQAARNELDRLEREFRTLPPRHDCSCYGHHCHECGRLARQRVDRPSAVEIGRSRSVIPPSPSAMMLDIEAGYAA